MIYIKFLNGSLYMQDFSPDVAKLIGKYGKPAADGLTEFEIWRFQCHVKQRDTGEIYLHVRDYDSRSRIAVCRGEQNGQYVTLENVLHHIRFLTDENKLEIVDAEFDDEQWSVPV